MSISSITHSAAATVAGLPTGKTVAAAEAQQQGQLKTVRSQEALKGFRDPQEIKRNVHEAITQINQELEKKTNSLAFSIDKNVSIPVVSVHNRNTGELIRQIPSEVVVKSAHSIEKLKGLLWDQQS
jgi:flagellar protein FlaG